MSRDRYRRGRCDRYRSNGGYRLPGHCGIRRRQAQACRRKPGQGPFRQAGHHRWRRRLQAGGQTAAHQPRPGCGRGGGEGGWGRAVLPLFAQADREARLVHFDDLAARAEHTLRDVAAQIGPVVRAGVAAERQGRGGRGAAGQGRRLGGRGACRQPRAGAQAARRVHQCATP